MTFILEERKRFLSRELRSRLFTYLFLFYSFAAYFVQFYKELKRKLFNQPIEYEIPYNLTDCLALITGGSGEIGLSCAKRLMKKNCYVVIATIPNYGQTQDELQQQLENELSEYRQNLWEVQRLDLGSFESINKFVQVFKKSNRNIDLLINNAGVFLIPFSVTEDGYEKHLGINYLGHCLLTLNLMPVLKPSKASLKWRRKANFGGNSKIVNIASYIHRCVFPNFNDYNNLNPVNMKDKESYSMYLAYSYSKLLMIAFNFYLSNHVLSKSTDAPEIVTLHPGINGTRLVFNSSINDYFPAARFENLLRNKLMWKSDVGASFVMHAAFSKEFKNEKDVYLEFFEQVKPNKICSDKQFQKKTFCRTIKLLSEHLDKSSNLAK